MFSRRQIVSFVAGAGLIPALPAAAQTWKSFRNARFGTSIEYPDRFRPGRPPENGGGLSFAGNDGANFLIYGSHNALEHDLAGLESFIKENRESGETITYETRGPNWFVISGTRGDTEFYERYLLSHNRSIVNGFVITYPVRLRTAYDQIVTRMSRSFRSGRGNDTEGTP